MNAENKAENKKENQMKTLRNHWATFAGMASLAVVAVVTVYACISAWGQTLPGLSIALVNTNTAVSLVVTNGNATNKYDIYWREFLDTNNSWTLLTNGGTGITNFAYSIGDTESGYFAASLHTNTVPFVLTVTIQAPASGANIQ
jgi:hypothetical protein